MGIQSSINQTLSLAAALASQSPAVKEAAERNKALSLINKKEKIAQTQIEQAGLFDEDIVRKNMKEITNLAQQRYDIDPTEQTKKALDIAKDPDEDLTAIMEAKREQYPEIAAVMDREQEALQEQAAAQRASEEAAERARRSRAFAELVMNVGGR